MNFRLNKELFVYTPTWINQEVRNDLWEVRIGLSVQSGTRRSEWRERMVLGMYGGAWCLAERLRRSHPRRVAG